LSADELRLPRAPAGVRVVEGAPERATAAVIDARLEQAYRRGLADGERRALETAGSALSAAVERLEALGAEARESVATTAVQLAVQIASQLLEVEVHTGRYDLERVVRGVLAASGAGRAPCVLHLHPEDAARLDGVPLRAGTEVEADPSVPRGDVHLTTQHGLFVRDLARAVREIGDRILGELR